MDTFKIGDKVKLKSGGPNMTVIYDVSRIRATGDIEEVRCAWFSADEYRQAEFPVDALEKVSLPKIE